MGASQRYLRGSATGAKAQDVKWLAADYTPDVDAGKVMKFTLQMELATAVVIQLTLDGTNFFDINGGVAVPANFQQFDLFAKNGDTINIRTNDVAGVTVNNFYLIADLS